MTASGATRLAGARGGHWCSLALDFTEDSYDICSLVQISRPVATFTSGIKTGIVRQITGTLARVLIGVWPVDKTHLRRLRRAC